MANAVEPIRDEKKIMAIRSMLKGGKHPRDYLIFVLGVNFALRIADLLSLRVSDVLDEQYEVRQHFTIREGKTGKAKRIKINGTAKEAIQWYFGKVGYPESDSYLFPSLRSQGPVDAVRVWTLMKAWCEAVGIKERIGTHSLRKTWGYHARMKGVPLELIQAKFGHSSPAVTRRYIGITADEIAAIEDKVCL